LDLNSEFQKLFPEESDKETDSRGIFGRLIGKLT